MSAAHGPRRGSAGGRTAALLTVLAAATITRAARRAAIAPTREHPLVADPGGLAVPPLPAQRVPLLESGDDLLLSEQEAQDAHVLDVLDELLRR